MKQLLVDCTEVINLLEEVLADRQHGLASSRIGKLLLAARSGKQFEGEAMSLLFTQHVINTATYTAAHKAKPLCDEQVARNIVESLVAAACKAGLATRDETVEDYKDLARQALKGRADGDVEDAAVLEGLKRANKTAETILVSADRGIVFCAQYERRRAVAADAVLAFVA